MEKNRSNNKNRNINTIRNFITMIIIEFIILLSFINKSTNISLRNCFTNNSIIILKIKQTGKNNILGPPNNIKNFNYLSDIYINGNRENLKSNSYSFDKKENIIKLIWNKPLDDCDNLFKDCYFVSEIDLSKFDTSQVTSMSYMFSDCYKLTSLNLSNFNTSKVQYMIRMFGGCQQIKSIDVSKFNTSNVLDMSKMFQGCNNLISLNLTNFDTSKVTNMEKMFNSCTVLKSLNLSNFNTSKVSDMNGIFKGCTNMVYINMSNFYINLIYNDKTKTEDMFKDITENLVVCINENIYPSDWILEQLKAMKCSVNDCTKDWKLKQKATIRNSDTCVECTYYHYFPNRSNTSYYVCTDDFTCPKEFFKLFEDDKLCSPNDIIELKNDLKIKKDENEINSKEEEIQYFDDVLKLIGDTFTSENYILKDIDKGNDEIIKNEKMNVTFTTSQNQKNNINSDLSRIDLGECEILLKEHYKIPSNEPLYMKKIDIVPEGTNSLKVEYEVYYKFSGDNLIKLNLSSCENSKISISLSFTLNDDIDKFNSSSGYYNDICYTTTSEDGTDISLKDRKNKYIESKQIICQEDCILIDYDQKTSKANCSCDVKEAHTSIVDMKFDKEGLLNNFKDIKNIANFNFLVCYKQLFRIEALLKNIGCYIMLSINLIHIISILIFFCNKSSQIDNKIKDVISPINEYKPSIIQIKNKKNKYKNKQKNKNKSFRDDYFSIQLYSNKKRIRKMLDAKKDSKNYSNEKINSIKDNNKKKHKTLIKEKFIDDEINDFPYHIALQKDKRNFCEYYFSLIKSKHNLISAFCNNEDYNSKVIKIDLFFIGFTIDYTVNALFFNDDTMHKIYEKKGEYNLETQIPIVIYSNIISFILNSLLNCLALSNDSIISFKEDKTKNNIKERINNLKKKLTIKFILFFSISFSFLLLFWYYISMFGVIYKNTQMHLLKDSLMSLGLSLLLPFATYLVPGLFRIPSLNSNKRKCLYNFSKCLQFF